MLERMVEKMGQDSEQKVRYICCVCKKKSKWYSGSYLGKSFERAKEDGWFFGNLNFYCKDHSENPRKREEEHLEYIRKHGVWFQ